MSEKRFPNEMTSVAHFGVKLEIRSVFAQELLKHYGVVAGFTNGEDKTGRAKIDLQEPAFLVQRAFAIADSFYDMAESRGDVQETTMTDEEKAAHDGKIARVRADAEWKGLRERAEAK